MSSDLWAEEPAPVAPLPGFARRARIGTQQVPVEIATLSDVVSLAASQGTTCALKRDGTVWCWGASDRAQTSLGSFNGGGFGPTLVQSLNSGVECSAPVVAPGASEVCDGLDDNCDGVVDNDCM